MRRVPYIVVVASIMAFLAIVNVCGDGQKPAKEANVLAPPEAFSSILDSQQRSAAYFTELSKVLTHPRCSNCHPADDSPRQGDDSRMHQPPVSRGVDGGGLVSMRCSSCHQPTNFDPARMPGAPGWRLAPLVMAWEGKTIPEICAQIKDPARNGKRSLQAIITHIATDKLVAWAWAPGVGREPAPGTQERAGALAQAWVNTGAVCPASSSIGAVALR